MIRTYKLTLIKLNKGENDSNITIPENINDTKPKISVIGIGGAGGNAVNTTISEKIENIDFLVANTDGQACLEALHPNKYNLARV